MQKFLVKALLSLLALGYVIINLMAVLNVPSTADFPSTGTILVSRYGYLGMPVFDFDPESNSFILSGRCNLVDAPFRIISIEGVETNKYQATFDGIFLWRKWVLAGTGKCSGWVPLDTYTWKRSSIAFKK